MAQRRKARREGDIANETSCKPIGENLRPLWRHQGLRPVPLSPKREGGFFIVAGNAAATLAAGVVF